MFLSLTNVQFRSWLIESDRLRQVVDLKTLEDLNVDLESEVSPFLNGDIKSADDPQVLNLQAEVFIGKKTELKTLKLGQSAGTVNLNIIGSNNPLFVDYAYARMIPRDLKCANNSRLHNTNVFSTIDNFSYKINEGDLDYQYLDIVNADYYVLGWHSNTTDEPFFAADQGALINRLKSKGLILGVDEKSLDVGKLSDGTRVMLHGAMYDVKYYRKKKPQCAADEAAQNFKYTKDHPIEPLSVGSTPIDGIITFLEAHKDDTEKVFAGPNPPGTDTKQLAKDILALSQLLYASDDSYNARIKASDMLLQNNYATAAGGRTWSFAGQATKGQESPQPSSI
jgi:hypothetical protein